MSPGLAIWKAMLVKTVFMLKPLETLGAKQRKRQQTQGYRDL